MPIGGGSPEKKKKALPGTSPGPARMVRPSGMSGPRTGKREKVHWHVGVPAGGNRGTKQARMGHAKKKVKPRSLPCPHCGTPTTYVHLGSLGNMRDWCTSCQAEVNP